MRFGSHKMNSDIGKLTYERLGEGVMKAIAVRGEGQLCVQGMGCARKRSNKDGGS